MGILGNRGRPRDDGGDFFHLYRDIVLQREEVDPSTEQHDRQTG